VTADLSKPDDIAPLHEVSDQMWSRVLGVNIASEAALRGNASGVAYTASKHAVVGLTRSAAFMYGPKGIRVNAVAPGGVATGIPTAAQLAASITFLLSDDGVNINGVVLPSDGGWSVQ